MKTERERIKELIVYLTEAKAKGWTLDLGQLAAQYGVTIWQVRQCVNEVYY